MGVNSVGEKQQAFKKHTTSIMFMQQQHATATTKFSTQSHYLVNQATNNTKSQIHYSNMMAIKNVKLLKKKGSYGPFRSWLS